MVYHLRMSREDPQLKLRLPAELKDQIEALAKANGRSMNAEIIMRLEASLLPGTTLGSDKTILLDTLRQILQVLEKPQD